MPQRRIRSCPVTDANRSIHRSIHQYSELDSTQNEARRLLKAGRATEGHVVLAERQTAGRGRFGRLWVSPKGGFYATFVLPKMTIPSIRVGLVLHDALERLGVTTQLKWPNDLLVGEKKLGGILVEEARGLFLAGVGVNLSMAPLPMTTSASQSGTSISVLDLLGKMLGSLTQESDEEVLGAYRSCCATIGRIVRIERSLSEPALEGLAVGVSGKGLLMVEAEGSVHSIAGGECFHLRTPDSKDR